MTKPEKSAATLETPATTGIGSLPHHNIDSALAFSFRHDVPYLPQIPIRNPWEFMIAQALEGMPGLEASPDGAAVLDVDVWVGRSRAFNERLLEAFAHAAKPEAFAGFEPSAAASSSWQPFLWELEERGIRVAKIQLAGPLTAQWVLRLKDGGPATSYPEISVQIFRLILARALAMTRRLRADGIQPVLFLDEPGLYGFSPTNARHVMGISELKLVVQALAKEGVQVGLHCCSNTDWDAVLQLGLQILSIDVELSLDRLLDSPLAEKFLEDGGRLSLGVVPTSGTAAKIAQAAREPAELCARLLGIFTKHYPDKPELVRRALGSALVTPACGLALHTPEDAEIVLSALDEVRRLLPARP